jgi:hypothetical protein
MNPKKGVFTYEKLFRKEYNRCPEYDISYEMPRG